MELDLIPMDNLDFKTVGGLLPCSMWSNPDNQIDYLRIIPSCEENMQIGVNRTRRIKGLLFD